MNAQLSPYHRPWMWLLRQASFICMFALAALLVSSASPGIPKVLALVVILATAVYFTLELITDILVAGLCRWSVAMGNALGVLVASCRHGSRKR